jgi:uncharacterized membrane protein YoaT (DUF817 family)
LKSFLYEFWIFGLKEARACIFAGSFFVILALSKLVHVPGLPRYDFILIAALLIQAGLVFFKIETWDEVKVLSLFHLFGLFLEIFKTQPWIGSWSYPEFGYVKAFGVPLYSGFMYAAVASYLCQAWRIFDLKFTNYPKPWIAALLAAGIYLNFFTHHLHYVPDLRWPLTILVFWLFRKTWVVFTVIQEPRRMPLALSFFLIGFFIWVAENMGTLGGAWVYPNQHHGWKLVGFGKIHSWSLLVILSFVIVADLKLLKRGRSKDADLEKETM